MYYLTDTEIEEIYNKLIFHYYKKHLESEGVKIPQLRRREKGNDLFTKDALVLVYLARGYPNQKVVTKDELTEFIRQYYPDTNDVQQARHLSAQKGWFIVSKQRGDELARNLPSNSYLLITLEEPYPGFTEQRRNFSADWEELKKQYDYRCATCGAKEGERHFHWKQVVVQLQKAHQNPKKELTPGNIIPQCQICNRADRNRWIYDDKGRVISIANPNVVKNCDKDTQRAIYKILYGIFNGEDPTKWDTGD